MYTVLQSVDVPVTFLLLPFESSGVKKCVCYIILHTFSVITLYPGSSSKRHWLQIQTQKSAYNTYKDMNITSVRLSEGPSS